mgnify:CR=1 FL=1
MMAEVVKHPTKSVIIATNILRKLTTDTTEISSSSTRPLV